MKFKKGLVSIVLNCYNGEKYLKEALSRIETLEAEVAALKSS